MRGSTRCYSEEAQCIHYGLQNTGHKLKLSIKNSCRGIRTFSHSHTIQPQPSWSWQPSGCMQSPAYQQIGSEEAGKAGPAEPTEPLTCIAAAGRWEIIEEQRASFSWSTTERQKASTFVVAGEQSSARPSERARVAQPKATAFQPPLGGLCSPEARRRGTKRGAAGPYLCRRCRPAGGRRRAEAAPGPPSLQDTGEARHGRRPRRGGAAAAPPGPPLTAPRRGGLQAAPPNAPASRHQKRPRRPPAARSGRTAPCRAPPAPSPWAEPPGSGRSPNRSIHRARPDAARPAAAPRPCQSGSRGGASPRDGQWEAAGRPEAGERAAWWRRKCSGACRRAAVGR